MNLSLEEKSQKLVFINSTSFARMWRWRPGIGLWIILTCVSGGAALAASPVTAATPVSTVSKGVDTAIRQEHERTGVTPAPACSDADYVRRVYLDIVGRIPDPQEYSKFCFDPSLTKRAQLVDQLLKSPEYSQNWARYWRDVLYMNATEQRARSQQGVFEEWMAGKLAANTSWSAITTEMVTATGEVQKNGATALFFIHGGEADEVAAECSRVFLGIQIQCANCHDHPSDIWKREQFHQLAAYFPRVQLKRDPDGSPIEFTVASLTGANARSRDFLRNNPGQLVKLLDRNGDGKISEAEAKNRNSRGEFAKIFDRVVELADRNNDKQVDTKELEMMPIPDAPGRGRMEYFMPDLNDPSARGKEIQPKFFVDNSSLKSGTEDMVRREELAAHITSKSNEWFSKAYVNRIWTELIGEGFYTPLDDLGPSRTPRHKNALEVLSKDFADSNYDMQRLIRIICATETYQRGLRPAPAEGTEALFAAALPARLRADQIFTSLLQAIDFPEPPLPEGGKRFGLQRSPRFMFDVLFGVDPSTPKEDVTGNIPQSLFSMNGLALQRTLKATGDTRLARILRDHPKDFDAINELYLVSLARLPTDSERTKCQNHVQRAYSRGEGFEDVFWSLVNSSEFVSRR